MSWSGVFSSTRLPHIAINASFGTVVTSCSFGDFSDIALDAPSVAGNACLPGSLPRVSHVREQIAVFKCDLLRLGWPRSGFTRNKVGSIFVCAFRLLMQRLDGDRNTSHNAELTIGEDLRLRESPYSRDHSQVADSAAWQPLAQFGRIGASDVTETPRPEEGFPWGISGHQKSHRPILSGKVEVDHNVLPSGPLIYTRAARPHANHVEISPVRSREGRIVTRDSSLRLSAFQLIHKAFTLCFKEADGHDHNSANRAKTTATNYSLTDGYPGSSIGGPSRIFSESRSNLSKECLLQLLSSAGALRVKVRPLA